MLFQAGHVAGTKKNILDPRLSVLTKHSSELVRESALLQMYIPRITQDTRGDQIWERMQKFTRKENGCLLWTGRLRMASDDQILEEINKFVTRGRECEVWQGHCNLRGAPMLDRCRIDGGKPINVRTFVWTFHKATLLNGEGVKSTCENPTCLNIDHLVTYKVNTQGPDFTTPDNEIVQTIRNHTSVRGECRTWNGMVSKGGRPYVTTRINGKPRDRNVRRILWKIEKGDMDKKTILETSCSNPKCVNQPGSQQGSLNILHKK